MHVVLYCSIVFQISWPLSWLVHWWKALPILYTVHHKYRPAVYIYLTRFANGHVDQQDSLNNCGQSQQQLPRTVFPGSDVGLYTSPSQIITSAQMYMKKIKVKRGKVIGGQFPAFHRKFYIFLAFHSFFFTAFWFPKSLHSPVASTQKVTFCTPRVSPNKHQITTWHHHVPDIG